MAVHGLGSFSSPIVITEDDEEAFIEAQLSATRSDDSQQDEPMQSSYTSHVVGGQVAHQPSAAAPNAGRKRRRNESNNQQTAPIFPPIPPQPDADDRPRKKKKNNRNPQNKPHVPPPMPLPPLPALPPSVPLPSPATHTRPGWRANTHAASAPSIPLPPSAYHGLNPGYPQILPTLPYNPYMPISLPLPPSLLPPLPPAPAPLPLPSKPPARLASQTNLQHSHANHQQRKNSSTISMRLVPTPGLPPIPLPPSLQNRTELPAAIPFDIPPPLPPMAPPPIAQAKTIGMPSVADEDSSFGRYPRAEQLQPPVDPRRTLVLELIPKKFRNQEFVAGWANRFERKKRVDVDPSFGKALVEFSRPGVASKAFASPRLTGGQGREHVRAYWFRMAPQTREMEEGEIEEGEVVSPPPVPLPLPAKPAKKKKQKKQKAAKNVPPTDIPIAASLPLPPKPLLPLPPPNSSTLTHAPLNLRVWHDPSLMQRWDAAGSSLPSAVEPELADEFGAAEPMNLETDDGYLDHADFRDEDEMGSYGDQSIASSRQASPQTQPDELPLDVGTWTNSDIAASLPEVIDEEVVTIGKHILSSPVAHIQLHDEEEDEDQGLEPRPAPVPIHVPVPQTIPALPAPPGLSIPPLPPPPPPPPRIATPPTPATDDLKRSLLARQKELEECIARTRQELARKSGSPAASVPPAPRKSSSPAAFVTPAATFNPPSVLPPAEKIVALAPPLANATPPVAENIVSPASVNANVRHLDTASAESELRRLVMKSRKGSGVASTPVASTPPPASPSVPAQFIQNSTTSVAQTSAPVMDNFEALAVTFIVETIETAKAPSLKAVQVAEKDDLAAKQKCLEQHIAESKLLMAKLSTAKTKEEKENILGILRERRRLMEEDMKADSPTAKSQSDTPTPAGQSWQRQRMRWPEPPPTPTVLVISDDEDDEM